MTWGSRYDETIQWFALHVVGLATPAHLAVMVGAVLIGILFGTLPGLSATIGIALTAGVTYGWPFDLALVALIGVYVGAMYGGSVSAILINIPGTGSAAATCLDGHPLALQGKAAIANRLARIASLVGTLFGMLVFVLLSPVVAEFALKITSPELFWLAFFGILICGSVAGGGEPLKGWIAGLIGIVLALVGLDTLHGSERLTFGIPELLAGIPFVPMTIAFFGIPQIVRTMQSSGQAEPIVATASQVSERGILIRNLANMLRWGSIGTLVGAIPGVGENIAAWVAYGDAKRRSRHPEAFGTGVYEGVMAPETANNAAIGGSIIPLVGLGIPGSPPTAMLLAALMMHGARPGPMLSIENPDLVPQLGANLLWATLVLFVCGMLLSPVMAAVLRLPQKFIMPMIAVLCVVGVFAYNNNPFHLAMVFVSGLFGCVLDRLGYSPAPLILGLILGGMADEQFRRTMLLNDSHLIGLVNRPLSLLLCVLCIAAVVRQVISGWPNRPGSDSSSSVEQVS